MAISLEDVNADLTKVKKYISKTEARDYVRDRGTCRNTVKLNGRTADYYRCNGSCAWSSSGR